MNWYYVLYFALGVLIAAVVGWHRLHAYRRRVSRALDELREWQAVQNVRNRNEERERRQEEATRPLTLRPLPGAESGSRAPTFVIDTRDPEWGRALLEQSVSGRFIRFRVEPGVRPVDDSFLRLQRVPGTDLWQELPSQSQDVSADTWYLLSEEVRPVNAEWGSIVERVVTLVRVESRIR